jgi:hypothetical protein
VAIALVGETNASNASSGTTQAVTRTTVAGNCLVVAVHIAAGSSVSVTSVTDTASNTWVKAVSAFQTSTNSRVEYWTCAGAASVTSVTATLGTASRMRVSLSEWSGVASVSAVEVSAGAGAAATTTPAAVTVTTAYPGDVVISGISYPNATAPTLGGPFTLLSGGALTTFYGAHAYYLPAATGSFGATWTLPAAVGSGAATIALTPAFSVGTTVASQNPATTTNTSLAVSLATTTVGELNVVEISGVANGTTINPTMATPTGWTKVGELIDTVGTPTSFIGVYARIFQTGDASSVTFSWTNAGQMIALATGYSGADATTPVPWSVFDFKVNSDTSYSIAGTTGAAGMLNYGFANRTGSAWSALTDTTRGQTTITSSDTMIGQVVPGTTASGTAFTKTATGSFTSVGVSWAFVVKPAIASTSSFAGSAALSGTGTLTSTAVPKPAATVALSGSGTLTGSAVPTPSFTAAFTGSGTLAFSGVVVTANGTAALTGSGSLTANVTGLTTKGTVALAGNGTLTGGGLGLFLATGTASFTGSGTLAASQALGSVLHPDNGAPDYHVPRFAVEFMPPTAAEGVNEGPLVLRLTTLPRGITLVRKGNSIQQVRFPTEDDLGSADAYWRGGYTYYLSGMTSPSLRQVAMTPTWRTWSPTRGPTCPSPTAATTSTPGSTRQVTQATPHLRTPCTPASTQEISNAVHPLQGPLEGGTQWRDPGYP